jgi:hypothetical protein
MSNGNKPARDARQFAKYWAKYTSLSVQWIVVFLIAAWAGSKIDGWLQTNRPYCTALTSILAVVWVMKSLIDSLSKNPQPDEVDVRKQRPRLVDSEKWLNADGQFWLIYLLMLMVCVMGTEACNEYILPIRRSVYYPILLAVALPVASMFISVYPIRKNWPEFFNRTKVLFSIVFMGLHFLFSLSVLIILAYKNGGLTAEYAIPFLLFFFVFLGILLVGIFSILRPISKRK